MSDRDPSPRTPAEPAAPGRTAIGAVLRAARLSRGQTLEAAAQQTRIPKRFLSALEEDRLDEFPAFVYMRGFLKGYCDYLDVPFEELWAQANPEARSPAAAPPDANHAPPPSAPPRAGAPAYGALLLSAALAAALLAWLARGRRASPAEERAAPAPPRALLPLKRANENKAVLSAVDDAWIRAVVDGEVVFEGRLPRGATLEWAPSRLLTLRATAASALRLTVNGAPRPLANPSADGEYRVDIP